MTRGSLPLDIKTRWNSTYLMLLRGVKYKETFNKMVVEDKLYNDYFLEMENGKKKDWTSNHERLACCGNVK